ncbi:radical SAM protein [Candidatus Woesearchaeota archaeon]|nr:radical SAM protein [Candidatus Woesearchaeota archaeon]
MTPKKLLLTGVFGPYGIKDKYAEGRGMQMELMSNQVTREQGVHSPRANFLSFGLYMMAENIEVPTTVLDFPRWKDFVNELKKGYTHVGISFIVPNVLKAKRMANYIRKNYPKTKIILGGYGTMIPEVRDNVPCDDVCHGEGVRWLREYFREDTEKPIKHPSVKASVNRFIYGYRIWDDNVVNIVPGVGCRNGCFFCSTSHKFGRRYIPFLKSGADMFAACHECEKQNGTQHFGVIDENFLKEPERAKELLAEMERHLKSYSFGIFSSAETINELGVDFLVRLGVEMVWIGAESERNVFNKTKGIDLRKLIAELQSNGITVLASTILFLEHHDKKSIKEDIDWAIGLGAEMNQFMHLIASPGTKIHQRFAEEGKLIKDFPYSKLANMEELCFKHPNFNMDEVRKYIDYAFKKNYEINGPGVLNVGVTKVHGYIKAKKDFEARKKTGLCWNPNTLRYEKTKNPRPDKFMELRLEMMRKKVLEIRPAFLASKIFGPNKKARKKSKMAAALYKEVFGKPTIKENLLSVVLLPFTTIEAFRIWLWKIFRKDEFVRQPPTMRVEYKQEN